MFKSLLGCVLALWAGAACAADKLQFGPVPAWVKPTPVASPPADPQDQAPLRRLIGEVQLKFDAGGTEMHAMTALRIQAAEGLAGGTVALTWKPDTDTVVVHTVHIIRGGQVIDVLARGQTFTVLRRETNLERAMLDGVLTATLQPEGLQVGDILVYDFTKRTLDPVLQGHTELVVSQLPGPPVDLLRARAIWPASHPMRWRQTAGWNPGTITHGAAGDEVVVEALNAQRKPGPKGAPPRYSYGAAVEFTDFASWGEISSLMAPLYRKASTLSANSPIKQEAARIKAASNDPKVQAALALRLVQDKIRYLFLGMDLGGYLPTDADVTWQRSFGDCKAKTAVLLALLRELGISAEPALVSTVAGDGLDERLPTIEMFNHILIRADIGGKVYWLDGTRSGDRTLDALVVPAFFWALPVRPAGATLEKLVIQPLATPNVETRIHLDATAGLGAPAPVHIDGILRGDAATMMRQAVASVPRSEVEKNLKSIWSGQYPWIEIQKVAAMFDEATGEERLTVDGMAAMDWAWNSDLGVREYESDGGRLGEKADYKRDPGAGQDAPYLVGHPSYARTVETIDLPQGGKGFAAIGADVETTVAGKAFKRTARVDGGVFTMEASTRSLALEFPASEASANRQALRDLWDIVVQVRAPKTYKDGDAELAIRLARTPTTAVGYMDRGEAHFVKHQPAKGVEDYAQALKLRPNDAVALNGLCFARARADLALQDALANCDEALDLEPKAANILDSRGFVNFRLGRMDKAIADLNQALKVNPDLAESLYIRGLAKRATGDSKGAGQDISAARKINPKIAATYADYGVTGR